MKNLVIIGACGEAYEIIDAVFALNDIKTAWNIAGIVDDDESKWETRFYRDVSILGGSDRIADFELDNTEFLITFGTPSLFLKKSDYFRVLARSHPGMKFATIVHPRAYISDTARIGHGTYVGAGVVVDANAVLGSHCIVHFSSVISRFVEVGDFTFISATVNITGNKRVGSSVYMGVNSTLHGNIGDNVLVSAGTLIKRDVPSNSVVSNKAALDLIALDSKEELESILSGMTE